MYRTSKTRDLVLKGIPESLRGELWLLFSGNYFSITAGGTVMLLRYTAYALKRITANFLF